MGVRLCWTVFSSVGAVHWCVYDTDAKGIVDLFSCRIFAVRSSRIVFICHVDRRLCCQSLCIAAPATLEFV